MTYMSHQKRWSDFAQETPDLADEGYDLLYQGSESASAFLATVAPDQGPRVHPVFPVVALGDLWLFIVNLSPKYRDLSRNGWFALHALPSAKGGEEFYVRWSATGCELKSVLYTRWENWGTAETWPEYSKWIA